MTLSRLLLSFLILGTMLNTPQAKAAEAALLFGLSQPILFKGYNVEVNYLTDNWVFEYSHGWDLKISEFESGLTDAEKSQRLKINTPYTTGGGVGYRFTKTFHAAIEYKVHQFDVTHPTQGSFSYTTQTLGVGVYYIWKPIEGSGLTIMPALRLWPTIATSLTDDKKVFSNGEVHEAHGFDLAPNIKVGWTF